MKVTTASVTLLMAALASALPQNMNAGNNTQGQTNNGGNTQGTNNGGNTNANGGNTNANGGNTNANGNGQAQGTPGNPAIQDGNNDVNAQGTVDQMTALLMQTAVDAWMRDTGVVSNFLNMGPNIQDQATFQNQAQIAHSAEVDELTHKAVLDQYMPNNQNVAAANATLTNGAFQLVVDRLDDMARQGMAQANGIDDINRDRCVNVLPNIDTYMREAALMIGNGQGIQQSVRPAACSNIVAGQNGALQVGQAPPGYVNGQLQNGNSNTNPNIAATPADDNAPEINVAGTGPAPANGNAPAGNQGGANGGNAQGQQNGQGQQAGGNTQAQGGNNQNGNAQGGNTQAQGGNNQNGNAQGGNTQAQGGNAQNGNAQGGNTQAQGGNTNANNGGGNGANTNANSGNGNGANTNSQSGQSSNSGANSQASQSSNSQSGNSQSQNNNN